MRTVMVAILAVTLAATAFAATMDKPSPAPDTQYAQWKHGPPTDPAFFPVAVWLQAPKNAPKFKAIGINVYIGQWKGPTEEDLAELSRHGMKVICDQNDVGLRHKDDPIIIGWMHGDEPDNCKRNADDTKWIPVARPDEIIADYKRMKAADPTRPVYLNLGCKVADEKYKGSWVRDHETYVEFLKGCDIVSYDIYPAKSSKPHLKGNLWYVPRGVDRLHQWSDGRKIVWNILECTPNAEKKPTPRDIKAEVWMSLVHGSTGICYFVHQFSPEFIEAGLLAYPDMAKAVGDINKQIHALAPVLNSPTVEGLVGATSYKVETPVDIMVKRHGGAVYVFAVAMRDGDASRAVFRVKPLDASVPPRGTVEVLGENRTIEMADGVFADEFAGYAVHLYRITPAAQ